MSNSSVNITFNYCSIAQSCCRGKSSQQWTKKKIKNSLSWHLFHSDRYLGKWPPTPNNSRNTWSVKTVTQLYSSVLLFIEFTDSWACRPLTELVLVKHASNWKRPFLHKGTSSGLFPRFKRYTFWLARQLTLTHNNVFVRKKPHLRRLKLCD